MDYGRKNTKKYNFICPNLKELRKLSSFVLDPLDFKQRHGRLLFVLSTDVVEGLMSVLVQFYDPLYRCFTFPNYQLVPMLEEYAHLLFLIGKAIVFAQAGSVDVFEAIFVLLIYGLDLFPNINDFVDVNAIRIFLIGNLVPTLLGEMYFSLHLGNSKGGGTIVCCVPLLHKCVDIIDSCGEFSNVPLIGTQEGINYNPALAHRQLGFPLREKPNNTQLEGFLYQEGKDPQHLKQRIIHAWHKVHRKGRSEIGLCNCVALEAYTIWVKRRALELKISYACERAMSLVVVEPSTLPNQELESKDKDALIELLEDRAVKRQRDPEGPSLSSMPQPSGAWKKIVDQLVLEKAQMKTSFESKIQRIQRKYTLAARSSDIIAKGSL
ncbi:hypothetical protein KIW84_060898 [Lathyrus oleraceus]|uniref:DUF7745 domain-containing protein n=1 Tax=Pisum sativum TaxID=3888 RepID=A0A9D4W2K6_PEA|nr:hypothetical protein KIW84_060898 [Pisum sativum]